MPRAISVWSESGGDGKTTMTLNVGAALGRRGHDVLLVDVDAQPASLTNHVGLAEYKQSEGTTIVDVLMNEDVHLDEVIVEQKDFDVVPAHEDLAFIDKQIALENISGAEFLLRPEIERLSEDYDYFLIDCPASLGTVVNNALIATRNVLMPVELTEKGRVSVGGLEDTISAMEKGLQRIDDSISLSILGLVPNRVRDSNIYENVRSDLHDSGRLVLPIDVRQRDVLKSAWRENQSIYEYSDGHDLRDYESDVLDQFDKLAGLIDGEFSLDDGSIVEKTEVA